MNQVASNARWLAVAQITKIGIQLLSVTILARLLNPQYYGIIALSTSVMALISLFRELGISESIIQTKNLTDDHKNAAFAILFAMSVFLFLVILISASFISNYYHEPDLKWVLILIGAGFPLSAIGIVPGCLMERDGRFKEFAILEAVTTFLTFAITITFALVGFGVYSLVVPSLLVLPIYVIWILKINNWRPSFRTTRNNIKALFTFSANLTGFNLINYLSRNLDVFLVGKMLGTVALGLYSTSMKLMMLPLQTITYVSNRAMFPVLSQLIDDQEGFKNTYLNTLSYVSLITFPMIIGLWVCRDAFVHIIYGNKWLGLIELLQWLCLAGLLQSINATTNVVFIAKAKTVTLFKLGIYAAFLQISAFYLGSQNNIKVMCQYYFFANILVVIPQFYYVIKLINSDYKELTSRLFPAIIATLVMLLFATIAKYLSLNLHNLLITLILQVMIGGAGYLITIKIMFPRSWETLLSSIKTTKR